MNEDMNIARQNGAVPMGTIVAFALNSIPNGWLLCDGSAIPAQYQNLITALGSSKTPNLAGRTLTGTGVPSIGVQSDGRTPNFAPSNNWPLGYTGGEYQHTLTTDEIPSHTHNYTHCNANGSSGLYGGSYWAPSYPEATTEATGGSQAHYNMQPYFSVNYIIYAGG